MESGGYYCNPRNDVLSLLRSSKADRILEIGGGDFPTLIETRSRIGGEVWGVDIRASTTKLDRMIVGSVTSHIVREQLSEARFDVIIANDVVEHIEDTEAFFDILSKCVADRGEILISVPNIRNVKLLYHVFLKGRFPRDEAGLFDKTHLRWFCRKDVEKLAASAGLRVADHRYSGRLIGESVMKRFKLMEFVALQNVFRLVRI
ncbi:class I SAM-dependent methyltransferase [Sphingopyxis sp.]|uniref:class I SAM-dependent methyltransferase n=1 Tax=Sphingopyxis sp. TaxID=1908224 RepID=UPI001D9BD7F3|nr:class I SAM-dependent methyltransferase [Sphingopyxis sp.]MBW8295553.1 class I SAM-dependent methyltransferase [Sphingopyxis sp.]